MFLNGFDHLIKAKSQNFENLRKENVNKFSLECRKEIGWLSNYLEKIISSYSHEQIIISQEEKQEVKQEQPLIEKNQTISDNNILDINYINYNETQNKKRKFVDDDPNKKNKFSTNIEKPIEHDKENETCSNNKGLSQQENKILPVEEQNLTFEEKKKPEIREEKPRVILHNLFEELRMMLNMQQERTRKDIDKTKSQTIETKNAQHNEEKMHHYENKRNQINLAEGKRIVTDMNVGYPNEEDRRDASKSLVSIPDWCQSPALKASLNKQATIDPETIFGKVQPLDMPAIFKEREYKFRQRTSSGNWSGGDALTENEELEYKKLMGYIS
nr:7297_t:CDS:2 [Entrophospora candida]CAG8578961.1 11418_t:CDS:2 [Entrophospora candida]